MYNKYEKLLEISYVYAWIVYFSYLCPLSMCTAILFGISNYAISDITVYQINFGIFYFTKRIRQGKTET